MVGQRFFLVGGAGFIGSHFTDRLLSDPGVHHVTLYDNFSSGREWHYAQHAGDDRLRVVRGDAKDLAALRAAMKGHEVVIHLASNPDIARAASEPDIDFREGTVLTQNVLEAMRASGAQRILYASGSGIYGDLPGLEVEEDHGPLLPISTYGASKLAGESLISAYCHMFGLSGCVFRFGNVVGPRQTHGVGFDFLRRLLKNPNELVVLGNGTQSKSYIHVRDVVEAVLLAHQKCSRSFEAYNVATGDNITVREIAQLAVECLGLSPGQTRLTFGTEDRGWKGDVPTVRLDIRRICALGWRSQHNTREALRASMAEMLVDARAGRLWTNG